MLFKKENNFLDDAYRYYAPDSTAYREILNNTSKNQAGILIVHDSFVRVVIPYLALSCKNLNTVDLRTVDEVSLAR